MARSDNATTANTSIAQSGTRRFVTHAMPPTVRMRLAGRRPTWGNPPICPAARAASSERERTPSFRYAFESPSPRSWTERELLCHLSVGAARGDEHDDTTLRALFGRSSRDSSPADPGELASARAAHSGGSCLEELECLQQRGRRPSACAGPGAGRCRAPAANDRARTARGHRRPARLPARARARPCRGRHPQRR